MIDPPSTACFSLAMTDQPPHPRLSTNRLILTMLRPSDASAVENLAGDPAVALVTTAIPHPYPKGGAEGWIDAEADGWADGTSASFAIRESINSPLIGNVSLMKIENSQAEIGYWLGKPHWGRGLMTEAVRAVVGFGFTSLRLTRIHGGHITGNPASGRVMVKAGFIPTGPYRLENWRNGNTAWAEGFEICPSQTVFS